MSGKKWFIALMGCCFLIGCRNVGAQKTGKDIDVKTKKEEVQIEANSSVNAEDCYICGNSKDSQMSYYGKFDSIGVIHWNGMEIVDTDVRSYDEAGNELFGQNGVSIRRSNFGDGYGSVSVNGTPNRGFSQINVYYKDKDKMDFNQAGQKICQNCLDQAIKIYEDQINYGKDGSIATTGYCLVDFTTRKLYTLSDPYRSYFIRDYFITYDVKEGLEGAENRIEILIVYAPERKRETNEKEIAS